MDKKSSEIRIVFMGTSDFAGSILSSLVSQKYNIVSVYTQKGKKIGRKQEIIGSSVKAASEKFNLPVYEPEALDEETIGQIKIQNPDMIIVASYGKILPKKILEIPRLGALNIHPSLLPKFRGPSPIQNALLLGEKETGTTIMLMDEGVDTGDILAQKNIEIDPDVVYPELLKKLAELSFLLLLETIPLWISGKITPRKQDNAKAIFCQLIERQDGKIIWADEAEAIYNRWRAFFLWPGIFSYWERGGVNLRIKLNKINLMKGQPEDPSLHVGKVFKSGDIVAVYANSGSIILEEIQLEGKNNMEIKKFINGYPDFIGSSLK
jgi:methionyl-tRNA formyltransferase